MALNYVIPVNFGQLTKRNQTLGKCDAKTSVQQHIYLILISRFGAKRYDYSYGCELWRYDFESISALNKIKPQLEQSLKELLLRYEPRLTNLTVKITIGEEELAVRGFLNFKRTKKVIAINIQGRLTTTSEVFSPPPFKIYFSPIKR